MNFEYFQDRIERVEARRESIRRAAETLLLDAKETRGAESPLTKGEDQRLTAMQRDLADADEQLEHLRSEQARLGTMPDALTNRGGLGAGAYARNWSAQVADKLSRAMGRSDGETRTVVSGTIDIPALVETEIIPIARPLRLIDMFPNRTALAGNSFEYYQQTVRTSLAAPVADNALKPTSTLTVAPHTDRCRVIAHLSEATPVRLWDDHNELQSWLTTEMIEGVLNALEAQIVAGDGTGENMLGLLATPGLTQVAFATDAVTTLRSAVTALQVKGETPNGWALNPVDAQAVDLLKWGTAGGFLSEGYSTGVAPGGDPSSNNIFGADVKRVVSNSVPAGVAILGDFSKLRVYVRQDANLAIDASGVLFTKNQFIARGEGRFGIGVLRPSAFAICDLTP